MLQSPITKPRLGDRFERTAAFEPVTKTTAPTVGVRFGGLLDETDIALEPPPQSGPIGAVDRWAGPMGRTVLGVDEAGRGTPRRPSCSRMRYPPSGRCSSLFS